MTTNRDHGLNDTAWLIEWHAHQAERAAAELAETPECGGCGSAHVITETYAVVCHSCDAEAEAYRALSRAGVAW